jgi:hypothetical protein
MTTQTSEGGTGARSGFGEALQANQIPLALIGVGIAWLLATNTGLAQRVAEDDRVQAARRRIGDIAGDLGISGDRKADAGAGEQILGPSGEPVIRMRESDRSQGWVHQAAGAARGALTSVRDAGSAVLDRASKYTEYAGTGDRAKGVGGQLAQSLERDPWLIGIFGMVAGAVIAALLPPTRFEQEYIGEARESLWDKAAELGHDAAERVRELAESTTRPARH